MTDNELFEALDIDLDGMLSRTDVHRAARDYGWHWQQAPFYALLDFLTIRSPLAREEFMFCMALINEDPSGVYGRVLSRGPRPADTVGLHSLSGSGGGKFCAVESVIGDVGNSESLVDLLNTIAGDRVGDEYITSLERMSISRFRVPLDKTALLLIDSQRSFTAGEWMQSLGPVADLDVMPICQAFDTIAQLLGSLYQRVEVMFTRCPFPPDSYGWDERFDRIIDDGQLYVIKPGNNALLPPGNGCKEWLEAIVGSGINTLVLGGCTLNSCLRVSAAAIQDCFRNNGLQVIVDLSLCGARASNFLKSELYNGISPVEAAIREMSGAGVVVVKSVVWQ